MWRRAQILTYIVSDSTVLFKNKQMSHSGWIMVVCVLQLSRLWTWATSRNAAHRTLKSPSPSCYAQVTHFHPLSSNFSSSSQVSPAGSSRSSHRPVFLTLDQRNPRNVKLFVEPVQLAKKRSSIPRSRNSLVTWRTWTGLMQTIDQNMLKFKLLALFKGHKWLQSLIQTQFSFTSATQITLEDNAKGLTTFFGFGTQFDEYTLEVM